MDSILYLEAFKSFVLNYESSKKINALYVFRAQTPVRQHAVTENKEKSDFPFSLKELILSEKKITVRFQSNENTLTRVFSFPEFLHGIHLSYKDSTQVLSLRKTGKQKKEGEILWLRMHSSHRTQAWTFWLFRLIFSYLEKSHPKQIGYAKKDYKFSF